jgi:glycosyltransferase involved in cell wall biosynthesis
MKRPRETVEAFLAARMPGWHLVLAGPEETVTGAELRALGGPVHVCGPVQGEQKAALLAGSDALVLFSHRENFGFVVTEALAYGTPVIVSSELDLAQELEAQGCGWVADGSTAYGRGAALGDVLPLAETEFARRGAIGRKWVQDEMSEERFASRLQTMVGRAIASRLARQV